MPIADVDSGGAADGTAAAVATGNQERKLNRMHGIVRWQHYYNGIKWRNLNDICLLISK